MKCDICELMCELGPDSHGRCGMYRALQDSVVPLHHDQLSAFSIGRIEDVPLLHFHPGSITLLIGTVGCNFDCSYCTNSYLARCTDDSAFRFRMSPDQLVAKAEAAGCRNIAFSINEPAASFPFFLEIAERARERGLGVGCATNGYFTIDSLQKLAKHIDFANISLKSINDEFYRRICRVPSKDPVLRNIKLLYDSGVHVEVTTPVTGDMSTDDIERMARFIGGIDRGMPWHLFRLLPEYKMEDERRTPIDSMLEMRTEACKSLDYVYIGNLVGSQWLDTVCPNCDTTLFRRVNATGCGSIVTDWNIDKGACPNCGKAIPIIGQPQQSQSAQSCTLTTMPAADEPLVGLIEVEGYSRLLDLRTGGAAEREPRLATAVAEITRRLPYPGDNREEADTWVTDVALKLLDVYPAELVMLDYAQALFIAANRGAEQQRAFENVFNNIDRFLSVTGYKPLIFGCGGLEPVEELVDLEEILGDDRVFALSGGKYAYISSTALESIAPKRRAALESLSKIIDRKSFLDSLDGDWSPQFAENLGDYIAIANGGVVFRGLGSQGRRIHLTPLLGREVSVHTALEQPSDILDVAPIVKRAIASGDRVALIIVEGADTYDFPMPTAPCRNYSGEFVYQTPWQQYYTLSTGIPYYRYETPLSNRHWLQDNRSYPFSGRFRRPAESALGQSIGDKKSLAIGNRSIITHVCLGADISAECYCCYMHNHGSLTVFRGKALSDS